MPKTDLHALSAVILASGAGTRLGEHTATIPKPLLEFDGQPYLYYLLKWLTKAGVRDIVVTTYSQADMIKDYITGEPAFHGIVSTVKEKVLISTVASAQAGLAAVRNPVSILLTADSVWDLDLGALYQQHLSTQADATVVVTQRDNFPNLGRVKLQPDRKVAELWPTVETPLSDQANLTPASTMGCYIVNVEKILASIQPEDTSIEREPMARLIPRVFGYLYERFFLDYGTPENYAWLKAHPEIINRYLL